MLFMGGFCGISPHWGFGLLVSNYLMVRLYRIDEIIMPGYERTFSYLP